MDNEVRFFDGHKEGEGKMGDVGVSEESMRGSNKLNDLDGEEVFEEAMDPQKHFHDQGDVVLGKGNDAAAAVREFPSTLAGEIPDDAEEVDNFEEAIGVADESGKHSKDEVIANQEVRGDWQGQPDSSCLDAVDSGGTAGGVSCDESYCARDDRLESSDCSGGKEVSDLNTGGGIIFKENRDLVDVNSGSSREKAENEDPKYMTPRQNGGMILENGSTNKVDYVVAEFHTESESNGEIPNQGADAGDLKEVGLDPEFRDDKIDKQLN